LRFLPRITHVVARNGNNVLAAVLGETQQNAVSRGRMQMPQHRAHGFVAFFQQYLGHVERRTPLCLQDQVFQVVFGNCRSRFVHRIVLVL
jgi:hypothetical protein